MKKSKDTTKQQTPTEEAPSPQAAKARKPTKVEKADADGEVTDRLPGTLAELKETKGGFVAHLFLTGKDRDAIAKELGAVFKLADAQALKITRRITARVRLCQRVFELVPAKEA